MQPIAGAKARRSLARDARGRSAKGSAGYLRGRPLGILDPRRRVTDLVTRPLSAQASADLLDRKPHLLRSLGAQLQLLPLDAPTLTLPRKRGRVRVGAAAVPVRHGRIPNCVCRRFTSDFSFVLSYRHLPGLTWQAPSLSSPHAGKGRSGRWIEPRVTSKGRIYFIEMRSGSDTGWRRRWVSWARFMRSGCARSSVLSALRLTCRWEFLKSEDLLIRVPAWERLHGSNTTLVGRSPTPLSFQGSSYASGGRAAPEEHDAFLMVRHGARAGVRPFTFLKKTALQ